MSDHEVPEAYRTAEVVRRNNAHSGTVQFNHAFSVLFEKYDLYWPFAYAWSLQQKATSFLWTQPADYRRPPQAVTDPTCSAVRIPGTQFGISTMQFILRIESDGRVSRVSPDQLPMAELTRLVDALSKLQPKKHR